jgi:hypothetical protein
METKVTSVLPPAHDWAKEYAELLAMDGDLGPEDLERGAVAADVLGEDEQAASLLDRAYRSYLEQGLPRQGRALRLLAHLSPPKRRPDRPRSSLDSSVAPAPRR